MYDGTIVVLYARPGLDGDAYYIWKANYGLNLQASPSFMLYLIINQCNFMRLEMYCPISTLLTIHMALWVLHMMQLLLSTLLLISTQIGFLKERSLHGQIWLTPSTNAIPVHHKPASF